MSQTYWTKVSSMNFVAFNYAVFIGIYIYILKIYTFFKLIIIITVISPNKDIFTGVTFSELM